MSVMRRAAIIAILLVLLILLGGCVTPPTGSNTTWKTPTPRTTPRGSVTPTAVVPTTTSPFIQVTVTPAPVETVTTHWPVITQPVVSLTLIDEKTLVFVYNSTAYTYTLENPPLLIEYTLTVPNITRVTVEKDPTKPPTADDPNPTRTVTKTYPDPVAHFEVTVKDLKTRRIVAQDGYGGVYDVDQSKEVWVRYPGNYYIEFSGHRVTANIRFLVGGTA